MKTVADFDALEAALAPARHSGQRVALVPTMGNLHAGHRSLFAMARKRCDCLVSSLFVNPMQFDRKDDLAAYPRTLERDADMLEAEGVDVLFSPSVDTIYPNGEDHCSFVEVPGLSGMLCGADRPGHFRGVATVVTILLNAVRPQLAVFGEKDFQQLLVIRRLVEDLRLPVAIEAGATVREADGLAMSSRNSYLNTAERARAPQLYRTLQQMKSRIEAGERDFAKLQAEGAGQLRAAGLQVDYLTIRRSVDLGPATTADAQLRILAAIRLGTARLIDNVAVSVN